MQDDEPAVYEITVAKAMLENVLEELDDMGDTVEKLIEDLVALLIKKRT